MECHGKEELLKIAIQSSTIFSERCQTITNWIIAESTIVIEIDYRASLAIDLPNGLKKENPLNLKSVSILEFEDNKIKRLADYS